MNGIKVLLEFDATTSLPIALIAHQQDIGLQLSNSGRLHQCPRARLEVFAFKIRIESLNLVLLKPFGCTSL